MNLKYAAPSFLIVCCSILAPQYAGAEAPAASSPTVAEQPQASLYTTGFVSGLAALPDGSFVVTGHFDEAGGVDLDNIARLSPDGSVDSNWAVGLSGTLGRIIQGPDGQIYATGTFWNSSGRLRALLVRLTADGTLDPTWKPNELTGGEYVSAVAFDGEFIYVSYASVSYSYTMIRRISLSSGDHDDDFKPLVDTRVRALAHDPVSGKLLVAHDSNGSYFFGVSTIDLVTGERAQLVPPGEYYHPFASGSDVVIDGTHAIIAANVDEIGGVVTDGLARISLQDGTADPAWRFDLAGKRVEAVQRLSDNSLLISGSFTSVNGVSRPLGLARLTPDGDLHHWNPAVKSSARGGVATTDGRIVLTGSNGRIAWLDAETGADVAPDRDPRFLRVAGPVAFARAPDGGLYFTGPTTLADGLPQYGFHRLHPDLTISHADVPGMSLDGTPTSIAVGPNEVYVADWSNGLARLSSSSGAWLVDWDLDRAAEQVVYHPSTDMLYVRKVSGGVRRLFAETGAEDTSWAAEMSYQSSGGTSHSVHGEFVYVAEGPNMSRFHINDGARDTGWQLRGSFNSSAFFIDDARGWAYTSRLSRHDLVDGALDTTWKPVKTPGSAHLLEVDSDGAVLAYGTFEAACGAAPYAHWLRILPSGRIDPYWHPQVNGSVTSWKIAANGTLVIGGTFTSVNGLRRMGIAGLGLSSSLIFSDGAGDGGGCVNVPN